MKCIFKIASLLTFAAAVLLSCDKEQAAPVTTGPKIQDLGVSFDKNIIRNDGETVTLKAYYKGQDVSDQASFLQYVDGVDLPLIMDSRVFSSDKTGEYRFQVAYGAAVSDIVSIKVVDQEIPGRTADPQPANTSFVHRTFFNQHTGANCGYCPGMTKLLKDTFGEFETDPVRKAAKQEVREKVVLAALRTYGGGEAGFAHVANPSTGWPYLHIDYVDSYDYNKTVEGLTEKINQRTADPAAVGISANPVYYAATKQIIVRVTVKAAVKGDYNVGLWLMQDNYYRLQSDNLGIISGNSKDPYHYHNNCVRVADSKYLGAHIGFPLGMLEAGQSGDWVFVFDLKDAIEKGKDKGGWWESFSESRLNDLHFAAFVTTFSGSSYAVLNAIDFPYNTPAQFDYKN